MFGTAVGPQYTPRKALGRSVPLVTSGTGTFDASERATVFIGPDRAGQRWHVTRLVTTAGTGDDTVILYVYRTSEMPSNIIDSTLDAVQATSETDFILSEGERLLCVWSGGTEGSAAVINVSGEVLY